MFYYDFIPIIISLFPSHTPWLKENYFTTKSAMYIKSILGFNIHFFIAYASFKIICNFISELFGVSLGPHDSV